MNIYALVLYLECTSPSSINYPKYKNKILVTPSNISVNPSCAICLENFDSLSEVKQLPTCHHVFHTNCLTEWLLRHGNCPMCRTRIPSIQQTPFPIFNDHWMQQFFFRTFGQQQISSSTSTDNTPQLPHFDSQTHNDPE